MIGECQKGKHTCGSTCQYSCCARNPCVMHNCDVRDVCTCDGDDEMESGSVRPSGLIVVVFAPAVPRLDPRRN